MALTLAVAMAGAPSVGVAAPSGDFEALVAEADEHAGAGRHAEALEAYAAAFEAMPEAMRPTTVGDFVARAAGKAALDDFEGRGEVASLERGRDVLEAFIAAAEGASSGDGPASTTAARERLDEIVARIPEPEPEPEVEVEAAPITVPTADSGRQGPSRTVGIALVAAGGASVLGGIGLVVAGARQVPWYEQQLIDGGWDPASSEFADELGNAERVRTIDLALGGALLGVGVGLGVAGGVILAKARASGDPAPVAFSLGVTRQRAMLGARWRF